MSEHHGADMLQHADQLAGTTVDRTKEHAIHSLHQCTKVCSCAPGYDLVQVVPSREALKLVSACYTDLCDFIEDVDHVIVKKDDRHQSCKFMCTSFSYSQEGTCRVITI